MADTPQRLADRLSSEGQKTVEFFGTLTPEQWDLTLYTDGSQWVVRQVLAHFVTAEAGFDQLMEHILSGGSGVPEDFDLDAYNERRVAKLDGADENELLNQFVQQRQVSVERVASLRENDLLLEGRHPFLGVVPIGSIIKLIYRHNQIHQRDIRKLLRESDI